MANTSKVVAIFGILVFLQVSCVAGRHVQVKDSGERVHDAPAVMSLTDFHTGPVACDGKSHSNDLLLASLTSAWYGGGIRCGKMIRIVTTRGVAVEAMVVEECDIEQGCGEHEISTSAAVWKALGVDIGIGELPVIWSDLD